MNTSIFEISEDMHVCYVEALSFPEGIAASQEQLHNIVPQGDHRNYFGISWPDRDGKIMYKAAAEEKQPGEAKALGLQTMIIKKGKYISIFIKDFTDDMDSIQQAFNTLLSDQRIDPQGFCLEWYLTGNDVRCMVRLSQ